MNIQLFNEIYCRTLYSIERNYMNFGKYDKEYWNGFNEGQLFALIRCANMLSEKNKNEILEEVEAMLY